MTKAHQILRIALTVVTLGSLVSCAGGEAETSVGSESDVLNLVGYADLDALEVATYQEGHLRVLECLSKEGFDTLTPELLSVRPRILDESIPAQGTREFAEQYGFGATDLSYADGLPQPIPTEQLLTTWAEESLTDSDLEAFDSAFRGTEQDNERLAEALRSGQEVDLNQMNLGCVVEGQKVHAELSNTLAPIYDIHDRILSELLETDSELNKAADSWRACMVDKGHSDVGDSPLDLIEITFNNVEVPEGDLGNREFDDADLQAERDLAVSSFDCSEESGYSERLDEIHEEAVASTDSAIAGTDMSEVRNEVVELLG